MARRRFRSLAFGECSSRPHPVLIPGTRWCGYHNILLSIGRMLLQCPAAFNRTRRKTWRAVHQTGHRHRPVQGPPRRCQAAAESRQPFCQNARSGKPQNADSAHLAPLKAFAHSLPRHISHLAPRSRSAASRSSLSRQARASPRKRGLRSRRQAARKAARTRASHHRVSIDRLRRMRRTKSCSTHF